MRSHGYFNRFGRQLKALIQTKLPKPIIFVENKRRLLYFITEQLILLIFKELKEASQATCNK
jgi:hypothetical protein